MNATISTSFPPSRQTFFPRYPDILSEFRQKRFFDCFTFFRRLFQRLFFDDGSDESEKHVVWSDLVQGCLQQLVDNPTTTTTTASTTTANYLEEKNEANVCRNR